MLKLILLAASYLIGSIPFGFIITHWVKKVDIRTVGSGNIGATNVVRVAGKPWGILVFLLDFSKGLIAPCLVVAVLPDAGNLIIILAAIAVICGHNCTCFLRFKGGKGVATSVGAIAGLCLSFPPFLALLLIGLLLIGLGTWIIVFFLSRIVSLASIASACVFVIFSFIFPLPLEFKIFSLLLAVFIVIRHKKNIANLFKNKELRF